MNDFVSCASDALFSWTICHGAFDRRLGLASCSGGLENGLSGNRCLSVLFVFVGGPEFLGWNDPLNLGGCWRLDFSPLCRRGGLWDRCSSLRLIQFGVEFRLHFRSWSGVSRAGSVYDGSLSSLSLLRGRQIWKGNYQIEIAICLFDSANGLSDLEILEI